MKEEIKINVILIFSFPPLFNPFPPSIQNSKWQLRDEQFSYVKTFSPFSPWIFILEEKIEFIEAETNNGAKLLFLEM